LYEDIIEMSVEKALLNDLVMIFPRYKEEPIRKCLNKCREDLLPNEAEIVIEHKEAIRWFRFIFSPIIDEHSNCYRVINTCIEITDKKNLENNISVISERYGAVVEAAYDGIITIDEAQNVNMINAAAKYIFGITEEEIIGQSLEKIMPKSFRMKHKDYVNSFKDSVVKSRPMQRRASVRGVRKDGTEFPIEVTISKIKVNGRTEMTAVVRDISERAKLMEELSKAAKEDALTGVYNRRHFTELLMSEIERCRRFQKSITLVMLDLDHFKRVNDVHGHDAGDYVLIKLSNFINDSIRKVDVFCRWGGEEFMVLLTETSLEDGIIWSNKMLKKIEDYTMKFDDKEIKVTCSFGIVNRRYDSIEMNQLLKDVDKQLYKAKKMGRNTIASD